MTTDLARQTPQRDIVQADPEQAAGALAHILGTGDLSQLTNEQRVGYYLEVCSSLGLNPRTRPFDWIEFYDPETRGKKLALYPNQSCAAQLRRQHQISVHTGEVTRSPDGSMLKCTATGTTPNGREGTATKYVSILDREGKPIRGNQLANAYMKCETGALRRLTFSMVGMASPPDMDELQRPRVVTVDGTGRVLENPTPEQKALAADPKMARSIGEPIFEDMSIAADDLPDQRVKPEELETPKREGPRPSFKSSDEQIEGWRRAWFATVKGLSLDTDGARAGYVLAWTRDELEWPEGKYTTSLATMFARMTVREADDFLGHVRALMEDERRELLNDASSSGDATLERLRREEDPKVRDAVALTGGPVGEVDSEPAF